ncbi:hypothetical protein D3C76_1442900 [compost metagenome]
MTGVGNQGKLAGLDPCQIDIAKVGNQQRRVMHAGFDRAEYIRVSGQRRARQHNQLPVDRIIVWALGRETGNLVTDCQVIDTLTDSGDDTGHLLANTRRQTGV